ncbi:MAG: outer membrane beta-barrel protein [Saprospiraceae bacterium]|nr:outer membrane beta-barrel protein [Saprospiraceae bacterium]
MKNIIILLVILGSAGSHSLYSQDIKSNISGFSLSASGKYAQWTTSSNFLNGLKEEKNNGPGLEFSVAYGFAEKISLYMTYSQSNFDPNDQTDNRHRSLSGGVKVHFGATLKTLRPFVSAGLANHQMKFNPVFFADDLFELEYDLKVTGIGAALGAGTQWFALPNLALSGGINGQFGSFTNTAISGSEYDPEETLDFRFINVQLGVSYFFQ